MHLKNAKHSRLSRRLTAGTALTAAAGLALAFPMAHAQDSRQGSSNYQGNTYQDSRYSDNYNNRGYYESDQGATWYDPTTWFNDWGAGDDDIDYRRDQYEPTRNTADRWEQDRYYDERYYQTDPYDTRSYDRSGRYYDERTYPSQQRQQQQSRFQSQQWDQYDRQGQYDRSPYTTNRYGTQDRFSGQQGQQSQQRGQNMYGPYQPNDMYTRYDNRGATQRQFQGQGQYDQNRYGQQDQYRGQQFDRQQRQYGQQDPYRGQQFDRQQRQYGQQDQYRDQQFDRQQRQYGQQDQYRGQQFDRQQRQYNQYDQNRSNQQFDRQQDRQQNWPRMRGSMTGPGAYHPYQDTARSDYWYDDRGARTSSTERWYSDDRFQNQRNWEDNQRRNWNNNQRWEDQRWNDQRQNRNDNQRRNWSQDGWDNNQRTWDSQSNWDDQGAWRYDDDWTQQPRYDERYYTQSQADRAYHPYDDTAYNNTTLRDRESRSYQDNRQRFGEMGSMTGGDDYRQRGDTMRSQADRAYHPYDDTARSNISLRDMERQTYYQGRGDERQARGGRDTGSMTGGQDYRQPNRSHQYGSDQSSSRDFPASHSIDQLDDRPVVLRGTVRDVETKTLYNQRGERSERTVAKVRMSDGEEAIVDLGDRSKARKANLESGDNVVVQGKFGAIDDRLAVMADKVRVNGETHQLRDTDRQMSQDRQTQQGQGQFVTIRGAVEDYGRVRLNGGTDDHTLVKLRLTSGETMILDLGPDITLSDLDLERDSRITVHGKRKSIEGQSVVDVSRLRIDNETTQMSYRN